MHKLTRKVVAGACAIAFVASGTGIAGADDIYNNLDASVDAVAETMGLTVGGANGSTSLFVKATSDGSKNGCDLTGANTLSLAVSSSNVAVATVSPASVTFTSCGDTKVLTVTPAAAGSATVSVRETANSTGGTFNLAPATFTVNVAAPVVTNTLPVLTVPAAVGPVEATGPAGAAVAYATSASDTQDGPLTPVCSPASGSTFGIGSTPVSCSVTDSGGLTATGTFPVVVQDTAPPVIVGMPRNQTLEATGPSGAAPTWASPTASDLVDGAVAVTCSPASGSTVGVGVVNARCSATDARGNEASGSFSVTVTDKTAPAFSNVPANQDLEATSAAGATATWTDPTATDLVDGNRTVACSPTSGSTFTLGAAQDVTCNASDTRGNTALAKFSIKVNDTTAPVLSGIPAIQTLEATGSKGAPATWTSPTALDTVDGNVTVSCDREAGSTFGLGTTTVSCTATDAAGNHSTGTFTITVEDTKAPVIIGMPDDQTLEATGPSGAAATWTSPTASDLVDGVVGVVCDATPTTFALGATTVRCSATDAARNASTGTFRITVQDTIAPAVTFVGGPAAGSSPIFGSVPAAPTCSATDVVSGTVSCTVTGWSQGVGDHLLTATATDGAGNRGEATRSYSVTSWRTGGFYSPVDGGGVVNTVKGGSTVPLKFEVFAGATELTQTSAVTSFTQRKVTCDGGALVDEIEIVSTGGTSLRYDATGGQFIQNWQTPKLAGTCYVVTVTMADGSSITASFKLK